MALVKVQQRLIFLVLLIGATSAFVSSGLGGFQVGSASRMQRRARSTLQLSLSPITFLTSDAVASVSNSLLIATVDADIANLSDNEFAPIFAGGILVMFGGLLSAIIVGTIVDKKNLYASIVAESYAQGGDDSEFWKGLSEEEKKKTQELLRKIKENDNNESGETIPVVARLETSSTEAPLAAAKAVSPEAASQVTSYPPASSTKGDTAPEIDMFSDY
jgi:hypothetical protein